METFIICAIVVVIVLMIRNAVQAKSGGPTPTPAASVATPGAGGESGSVAQATRRHLTAIGLPAVKGGQTLGNVPILDPSNSQVWDDMRPVLTVAHIVAHTPDGNEEVEMLEMNDGYVIAAFGKRLLIAERLDLSDDEADELQKQRATWMTSEDNIIEALRGARWEMTGAAGDNSNEANAADHIISYVQVISTAPTLNKPDGYRSVFPLQLLSGERYPYYDIRARNGDKRLFAFYAGGEWNAYVGRILSETESAQIEAY